MVTCRQPTIHFTHSFSTSCIPGDSEFRQISWGVMPSYTYDCLWEKMMHIDHHFFRNHLLGAHSLPGNRSAMEDHPPTPTGFAVLQGTGSAIGPQKQI